MPVTQQMASADHNGVVLGKPVLAASNHPLGLHEFRLFAYYWSLSGPTCGKRIQEIMRKNHSWWYLLTKRKQYEKGNPHCGRMGGE